MKHGAILASLAEHTPQICAEVRGNKTKLVLGSKGDQYQVTITDKGYSKCTCKGHQFRRHCRHVEQVQKESFCWQEGVSPKKQTFQQQVNMICPVCGGPTRYAD